MDADDDRQSFVDDLGDDLAQVLAFLRCPGGRRVISGSGFTMSFTNSKPLDLISRMSSRVNRMIGSGGIGRNWRSRQIPRFSSRANFAGG